MVKSRDSTTDLRRSSLPAMGFLRRALGQAHQHAAYPPGWASIADRVRPLYSREPDRHWGTIRKYRDGGPDPLDGVDVYANPGPPRHWHHVTYGLTELYRKESPNAAISGFGIELTFRLARIAGERKPPVWAVSMLQNLARYVFETGRVLEPNHHMSANGPIRNGSETGLTAFAFTEDPELGHVEGPFGHLRFVQVVGITDSELQAMLDWSATGVLGLLRARDPLLTTDLDRTSILDDPGAAAAVQRGIEVDGSSLGGVNTDRLTWQLDGEILQIVIGALAVPRLAAMLRGRTLHDRPFYLAAQDRRLEVMPARSAGWRISDDGRTLALQIPPTGAADLARALRPVAGTYETTDLAAVQFIVEPTAIRDPRGNVVEIVGQAPA